MRLIDNSIEFALGYSKSTDYKLRVQLQLYSVLLPMGEMYYDCNHNTIN